MDYHDFKLMRLLPQDLGKAEVEINALAQAGWDFRGVLSNQAFSAVIFSRPHVEQPAEELSSDDDFVGDDLPVEVLEVVQEHKAKTRSSRSRK